MSSESERSAPERSTGGQPEAAPPDPRHLDDEPEVVAHAEDDREDLPWCISCST